MRGGRSPGSPLGKPPRPGSPSDHFECQSQGECLKTPGCAGPPRATDTLGSSKTAVFFKALAQPCQQPHVFTWIWRRHPVFAEVASLAPASLKRLWSRAGRVVGGIQRCLLASRLVQACQAPIGDICDDLARSRFLDVAKQSIWSASVLQHVFNNRSNATWVRLWSLVWWRARKGGRRVIVVLTGPRRAKFAVNPSV